MEKQKEHIVIYSQEIPHTYQADGKKKIETVNWKYGDIYNASNANNAVNVTAAGMVQKEQAWTDTVNAKIGLMYLADY